MTRNYSRAAATMAVFFGALALLAALATANTVIVEVELPDKAAVDRLTADGYVIDAYEAGCATLYVPEGRMPALRATGLPLRITGRQPDWERAKQDSAYPSYAEMTARLESWAAAYPAITRLESLGQSVQGRELWAMLITDYPDEKEDEPAFKYVSTMHGDEPLGTVLCMEFIGSLLEGYGIDPRRTALIDETEIWVVPLMNPDGYEAGTRFNAQGKDLNRSFPVWPTDFAADYYHGDAIDLSGYPPEVRHIAEWTLDNTFVLSANIHTGEAVVNYPYDEDGLGSFFSPTPDHDLFVEISLRYALANDYLQTWSPFPYGITNGADWYTVFGGMQDWNYRYAGCNEVTIELCRQKWPPASQLQAHWEYNEESMLRYAEACHMGIRGVVTDLVTGEPCWATVRVHDNTQIVWTDPDVGDFHRMLLPGVYSVTIDAGYGIPATFDNVVVNEGAATRLDVAILPADPVADGVLDQADVTAVIDCVLGAGDCSGCDLDGGGVGATDIQLIINYVYGRS